MSKQMMLVDPRNAGYHMVTDNHQDFCRNNISRSEWIELRNSFGVKNRQKLFVQVLQDFHRPRFFDLGDTVFTKQAWEDCYVEKMPKQKTEKVDDYDQRLFLANMIGLEQVPKADEDSIDRIAGIFSDIFDEGSDAIEYIKDVRG